MNGTSKMVNIQNADGSNEQNIILNSFKLADINKKFVIYHKNEIANGVQKIYVSEVEDKEPGLLVFKNVEDDALWNRVKEMLKVIANYQADVTDNDSYLEGYNISDTCKIVKQGSKEIGVRDVNPLIKTLPIKEVAAPQTSAPQVQVNETPANTYVENPFSAPSVTPTNNVETTPLTSAPVMQQAVQNDTVVPTLEQTTPQNEVMPNTAPVTNEQPATQAVNEPVMQNTQPVVAPVSPVQNATSEPVVPAVEPNTSVAPVNETVTNPNTGLEQTTAPVVEPVTTTQSTVNEVKNENNSIDTTKEIEDIINDYFDIMKAEVISKVLEALKKKDSELTEVSNYAANAVNTVNNQVGATLYNPETDNTLVNNSVAPVMNNTVVNPNDIASPRPMVK